MVRSDAAISRYWQEWVNVIFQCHQGSGQPRATADRQNRLITKSAVTVPDSSFSTIRRATHIRVSTMTIYRRLIERNLRFRTPLFVIRGTLTAQQYVDDILRTVLPSLICLLDNARLLTACIAMNCLTARQALPWQARSLDLSPIELVCNMMGRRLHVDDLARQLEQI
ncbi:transposable element Tc1 transposase [Trichonephila clavipes]|uniref:Transposable element Tc1 transposase n=1 Tax=Trichonephila clavipes TaxID=2585209 RepID=A0A8X6V3T0_TRICX|nr:transposable element Tc1 transposase [Trichonephila clavipes]